MSPTLLPMNRLANFSNIELFLISHVSYLTAQWAKMGGMCGCKIRYHVIK